MARTIRPRGFGVFDVFEDGKHIAEFDFCRDRRDIGGRIEVRCAGQLRYDDGRKVDLSNFCWVADVRRYIKEGAI